MFVLPEATAATAKHVTAGLLVGNHAHANGRGELPPDEARSLFAGDILLITAAVSESKGTLQDLPVGKYNRLKDIWEVIPLTKYTTPKSDKPRVFLANPGWMLNGAVDRQFGAIVIDGAHPRTNGTIAELLRVAESCSPLRLVVVPPISEATLRACGYPGRASIWVWDPQAMADVEATIGPRSVEPKHPGERFLWVCDGDPEAADVLSVLYRELVAALKAANGRFYPGLGLCWAMYDRLRQLSVPLAHLEQMASKTWAGSLRDRLDSLSSLSGHGDAGWETTWPQLTDALSKAYQTLLKREETAKFWALAGSFGASMPRKGEQLRVVVSSSLERELLVESLVQVVDGIGDAMADGRLEIVTMPGEARLVSEGQLAQTFLLGPRSSRHRYLDVFASRRVDEFVYPHELQAELSAQSRLHAWWAQAAVDESRVRFLEPLGFAPPPSAPRLSYARPRITVGTTVGDTVKLAREADVSASLSISDLIDDTDVRNVDGESPVSRESATPVGQGDVVEITFSGGEVQQYYASQSLDVFFSESGTVQRYLVADVRPGWQVISFVDGRYDGLFNRLTEVVNSRLQPRERVALELWQTAKDNLFARYPNKTSLYEKLSAQGLTSTYEAFMNWFDGPEGNLAPQQFSEFEVVARECPTYQSDALISATFEAVKHRRGRNRACGRQLKKFLRAVVSGDGYNDALESARQLDTALADVLAAVEVLDVHALRVLKRTADGKREAALPT